MDPAPPYSAQAPDQTTPTLLGLPPHLLQRILAQVPLPTLLHALLLVDRRCHQLARARLRALVLPVWLSKISPTSSSDPFGGPTLSDSKGPPRWQVRSREMAVLDLFVVAVVQETVNVEESELLLPATSHAIELDLFQFLQPRARTEDLAIALLAEDPVPHIDPHDITVTLASKGRRGSLLLPFRSSSGGRNTVAKVVAEARVEEGDPLERLARRLVQGLRTVPLRRTQGVYERI